MKIIWGPYERKDGRRQVDVEYDNGKRKSMLFSRFLMESKLGRELSDSETVDHIDGNKYNDSIDNLQVLSRSQNASKDAVRVVPVIVKCSWCFVDFTLTRNQRKSSSRAGPFCSRSCSGKYGKAKQMGDVGKMSRTDFTVSYFKESGADLTDAQKALSNK